MEAQSVGSGAAGGRRTVPPLAYVTESDFSSRGTTGRSLHVQASYFILFSGHALSVAHTPVVFNAQVWFCRRIFGLGTRPIVILRKEVVKMTVSELLKEISRRKDDLNLTNRMISDASGVPKSTVDRVLRGETNDPSAQTVLDMAFVVGFRLVNDNDQTPDAVDGQLVSLLERENRLKTVQSNALLAAKDRTIEDKSRWVRFLTASTISFAVLLVITWAGIALLLHYDLTHLDMGYFRR